MPTLIYNPEHKVVVHLQPLKGKTNTNLSGETKMAEPATERQTLCRICNNLLHGFIKTHHQLQGRQSLLLYSFIKRKNCLSPCTDLFSGMVCVEDEHQPVRMEENMSQCDKHSIT